MRLIQQDKNGVVVEMSKDDLLIINNALNESIALIDEEEFSTRVGLEKSFAREVLIKIGDIFDSMHEFERNSHIT